MGIIYFVFFYGCDVGTCVWEMLGVIACEFVFVRVFASVFARVHV